MGSRHITILLICVAVQSCGRDTKEEKPQSPEQREAATFSLQTETLWVNLYGEFPEWARDLFEPLAALAGFYLSTLEGEALVEAKQQIYGSVETSAQYAKIATETDAPKYVLAAEATIGRLAVTAKTSIGYYYGETSKEAATSYGRVDRLQDEFSKQILAADSEDATKELEKEFNKQLPNVIYQ
jgi:hypothetical protein